MKVAFALLFVAVCYVGAGTLDWSVAQDKAEAKAPASHPARIWSKKCEMQGKRVLAKQADGGKWKVYCIDAKVLRV